MAGLELIGGEDRSRPVREHSLEAVLRHADGGSLPPASRKVAMVPLACPASTRELPRIPFLVMQAGAAVEHTIDRDDLALEPDDNLASLIPSWRRHTFRHCRRARHGALLHGDAAEAGAWCLPVAGDQGVAGLDTHRFPRRRSSAAGSRPMRFSDRDHWRR